MTIGPERKVPEGTVTVPPPAAPAAGQRGLDRRGVVGLAVADRAVGRHVEGPGADRRQRNRRVAGAAGVAGTSARSPGRAAGARRHRRVPPPVPCPAAPGCHRPSPSASARGAAAPSCCRRRRRHHLRAPSRRLHRFRPCPRARRAARASSSRAGRPPAPVLPAAPDPGGAVPAGARRPSRTGRAPPEPVPPPVPALLPPVSSGLHLRSHWRSPDPASPARAAATTRARICMAIDAPGERIDQQRARADQRLKSLRRTRSDAGPCTAPGCGRSDR